MRMPRTLDVRFVEDADWSHTWRNYAIEHCFGDRLWVLPRDAPLPSGSAAVLRIDPGLAFGTGGHATTAMCLEWLARQRIDGWSVVDYGAGSGILGIAALLLGARHVIAVDHDPQACLATRANATYNGVASERITIIAPDGLASDDSRSRAGEHPGRTVGVARADADAVGQAGRRAGDVGHAGASTRRGDVPLSGLHFRTAANAR